MFDYCGRNRQELRGSLPRSKRPVWNKDWVALPADWTRLSLLPGAHAKQEKRWHERGRSKRTHPWLHESDVLSRQKSSRSSADFHSDESWGNDAWSNSSSFTVGLKFLHYADQRTLQANAHQRLSPPKFAHLAMLRKHTNFKLPKFFNTQIHLSHLLKADFSSSC